MYRLSVVEEGEHLEQQKHQQHHNQQHQHQEQREQEQEQEQKLQPLYIVDAQAMEAVEAVAAVQAEVSSGAVRVTNTPSGWMVGTSQSLLLDVSEKVGRWFPLCCHALMVSVP